MKREKDDEKIMGPMFPRLHVNDADKGGPKAPPRNKMALYEQLSVPSQRFNHQVLPVNSNNPGANSVPPSSQGGGNERGSFFSYQLPTRHQSEKQYSQYSDLSTKSTQVEQRKRSDEDDFTVPIFVHPVANQESAKYANELGYDKLTPSNPSYSSPPSVIPKPKNNGVQGNNTRQESLKRQTDSSTRGGHPANCEDRLRRQDSEEPAVMEENIITDRRNSCIPSENQNGIFHDVRNETGSREDSVSETSVVDSISRVDMTPDDVVGIIGHRHFWKARKAIVNQQRVFSVQVFELHRLLKVQRLIATSPHLMLEDSTYVATKQTKPKKNPLNYPIKPIPNISKPKPEPEKPSHKKESSAENTIGKSSFSSIQNGGGPPTSTQHPNARSSSWCYNQPPPGPPNHHQWLIPVMSPSEGLVYKPYPFVGPTGPNPSMSGFVTPAYGVPAPPYQIPSFPPPPLPPPGGPHSYFSPYGMPVMNPTQILVGPDAAVSMPHHHGSEDVDVQASTASSPVERQEDNNGGRNVLPLFPTSPTVDPTNPSSEPPPEPEGPTQVIKVVPHNARSATESAARIFRSIQEERKQFETV